MKDKTYTSTSRTASCRVLHTMNATRAVGHPSKTRTATRFISHVVAVLLLAVCLGVGGLCMMTDTVHAASNFVIEDYDVDMVVQEDDTYVITETLKVHFTAPSHGIYRTIPYRTELDRDGQYSLFFAKVRDFEMLSGQPFKKQRDEKNYNVRIGEPDVIADTDTTYKIRFVFDNRGDHLNGADEVYYNLIGKGWEAKSIDHVSFKVTFPKPIDPTKVGMKTGYQIDVPFEVKKDRIVQGETTENVMGGLTIRAVLPEGYFTKQAKTSNLLYYLLMAALVVLAGVGFVFWRRYGKDPHIVETEEFYPPDGLSAPEIAYLLKEELENKQIISILLTLADKGYIKITEKEVKKALRKKLVKEYELTKLKDYDEGVIGEKTFMNGLFKSGDVVNVKDLQNKFYKTVEDIKKKIIKKYEGDLYDPRAEHYANIMTCVGSLGIIALVFITKLMNGSSFIVDSNIFMSIVLIAMQIILPIGGFWGISRRIKKGKKNPIFYILWALLALLGIGIAALFETFISWQVVPFFIGMGMCLVLFILSGLCERKTDYYADLLGRIRGYKRFLQMAEKDQMEMLAEQDPGYYYRNLAFAFALGVTSVYAAHFIKMATEPPQWYDSPILYTGGVFDAEGMMGSMDHMFGSMSSTMTSSPSGGGGGGSFSGGGGGGGGGGGSW